ncbi:hypothetical protein E2C01_025927 [Portunus trituberculatus]|uniref:Uncharacterized protein n=1 Tax=Portunus trituberculatus TaxID=210409 RepID=A0A5B7EHA9_PORTR|nr:hypothetical protein [Portunus trituberculatus]
MCSSLHSEEVMVTCPLAKAYLTCIGRQVMELRRGSFTTLPHNAARKTSSCGGPHLHFITQFESIHMTYSSHRDLPRTSPSSASGPAKLTNRVQAARYGATLLQNFKHVNSKIIRFFHFLIQPSLPLTLLSLVTSVASHEGGKALRLPIIRSVTRSTSFNIDA